MEYLAVIYGESISYKSLPWITSLLPIGDLSTYRLWRYLEASRCRFHLCPAVSTFKRRPSVVNLHLVLTAWDHLSGDLAEAGGAKADSWRYLCDKACKIPGSGRHSGDTNWPLRYDVEGEIARLVLFLNTSKYEQCKFWWVIPWLTTYMRDDEHLSWSKEICEEHSYPVSFNTRFVNKSSFVGTVPFNNTFSYTAVRSQYTGKTVTK